MKILILAIGKLKDKNLEAVFADYQKRLRGKVEVKEFDIKDSVPAVLQKKESEALPKNVPSDSYVAACHGAGKQLDSREFSKKLESLRQTGRKTLVFLIGGADGHTPEVLKKADFAFSFGTMTWPHRLARVMLIEQLYRAQEIAAGNPY